MSDLTKKSPTPEDAEASFRDALEDIIAIASPMAEHCNNSIVDLVTLARLALDNDVHLRFLLSLTQSAQKPKR